MRTLKDFAAFIKKHHLQEYVREGIRISRSMDIPIMKLFSHIPEEQLIEMSNKSSWDFLTSLEEGTASAIAKENLRKWEADELEGGLSKNAIHPSDLVLLYAVSKQTLLPFLPKFSDSSQECVQIVLELEAYFTESQDAAIQLLFKLAKEAQEELHEKERTQAQFLNGLPIGITIVEAGKTNLYYVNEAAKQLLGEDIIDPEKAAAAFKYFKVSGEPYPTEDIPVFKALNGNYTVADDMVVEVKGKKVPLEIWATPVFDKNNQVKYAIAGFNDITERKRNQNELLLKTEELIRSNRELELFASIASHDLQEPLRTISSYLGLLQRKLEGKIDEETVDFMNLIIDGSIRMRTLINNLLEYSRITRSNKPFQSIDTAVVIEEVKKNLQNSILDSKTKLTVKGELPQVKGDSVQVVQLFQNLISNGIKFHQKKKHPDIVISAMQNGTFCEFCVEDKGIGIDQKYSVKIFEIFQRLNSKEAYPGTGLGLAICKKIVERHGGEIWMKSEPGKGTSFFFTLPC